MGLSGHNSEHFAEGDVMVFFVVHLFMRYLFQEQLNHYVGR